MTDLEQVRAALRPCLAILRHKSIEPPMWPGVQDRMEAECKAAMAALDRVAARLAELDGQVAAIRMQLMTLADVAEEAAASKKSYDFEVRAKTASQKAINLLATSTAGQRAAAVLSAAKRLSSWKAGDPHAEKLMIELFTAVAAWEGQP